MKWIKANKYEEIINTKKQINEKYNRSTALKAVESEIISYIKIRVKKNIFVKKIIRLKKLFD
jgi:hypothetical protein